MIRADMKMAFGVAHVRGDAINHARRLEQAHHFMVEMHRARQRIGMGLLLDHQDRQARFSKEIGRKGPHRPAADDRNVEHGSVFPVRRPRAGARVICASVRPA